MTYADKFKDPRWQKKRLEIFEYHRFECQSCGSKEKTLHVHHKIYIKGRDPWDYLDEDLMCLCEGCHNTEHKTEKLIKGLLAECSADIKAEVIGFLACAMGYKKPPPYLWYEGLIGWFKFKSDESIKKAENFISKLVKKAA